MTSKYSELLRDPRWQKKRLEVMQRDHFTCQHCKDTKSTLNVHHCYYGKTVDGVRRMPWDYEISSLVTLCEDCHGYETDLARECKDDLIEAMARNGAMSAQFFVLASAINNNPIDLQAYAPIIGWLFANKKLLDIVVEDFDRACDGGIEKVQKIILGSTPLVDRVDD